jgi:SanA protein
VTTPRRPRARRFRTALIALALAVALALAACNVYVTSSARARITTLDALARPRAFAIVPGARVNDDGRPSLALQDRLDTAAEAFRRGLVRRVLVSADDGSGRAREVDAMARWLIARGVLAAAVVSDRGGVRTAATMSRAATVFGVRDALVCTQRFHLPRALYLARAVGIDAVGVPADRRAYPHQRFDDAREFLARVRAVFDASMPRRGGT